MILITHVMKYGLESRRRANRMANLRAISFEQRHAMVPLHDSIILGKA